jgi:hypothetical protein
MEEEETNVVEKPRPWGFIAGWDKSYEMIDKTSWEVKRARETFRLKATKAKIFIEKGGGKEEGRDEVLPSSLSSWIEGKRMAGLCEKKTFACKWMADVSLVLTIILC